MKNTIIIVCLFALVCVGLVFARNMFFKGSVEDTIKSLTGLPAQAECVESGYFIRIKGLKIKNPQGFSSSPMMDISSVKVDKNLGQMEIRVKNLLIEKSQTGRVNINYLTPNQSQLEGLQIKTLKLHMNKVTYKDMATGRTKEYEVNIHREYGNLPNPGSAVSIIVNEGLGDIPIGGDITPPATPPSDPPIDEIIDDGQDIPEPPPGDGDDDDGDGDGDTPAAPGWTGRC